VQQDLAGDGPVVEVHGDKGEIILNTASRPLGKKKADMIIRAIMLAYHSAKCLAGTEEDRDDKFYHLVKKVLKGLV
jgi:hypothetical protein